MNIYYYKSWWTADVILHISPHWNHWNEEGKPSKEIDVWVSSNAAKVKTTGTAAEIVVTTDNTTLVADGMEALFCRNLRMGLSGLIFQQTEFFLPVVLNFRF